MIYNEQTTSENVPLWHCDVNVPKTIDMSMCELVDALFANVLKNCYLRGDKLLAIRHFVWKQTRFFLFFLLAL